MIFIGACKWYLEMCRSKECETSSVPFKDKEKFCQYIALFIYDIIESSQCKQGGTENIVKNIHTEALLQVH